MNKIMSCTIEDAQKFASEINMIKNRLMQAGLYRTAHKIDIATQEIGFEMIGEETPEWQKKRQLETLNP